jgi:SAM-dependent methyltransferase
MDELSERRRLSFGSVAEQYDRARPGYPEALIDETLAYAGVTASGGPQSGRGGRRDLFSALEVGAGTGIATRQFAARGLAITVLEPDPEMIAVNHSRADLEGIDLTLQLSDFEHAEFEPHSFQLVYSATAWHWVTPGLRYELAARALVSGGALATFWNTPAWSGVAIRPALNQVYDDVAARFGVTWSGVESPTVGQPETDQENEWERELDGSLDFTDFELRYYTWRQAYTREQYLALIGTHSDHVLLGDEARAALYAASRP